MKKLNISAVVITKNEARQIENCLKSLNWVNEVILVDNKSYDNTKEIAARYTDKIFNFEGFHLGKQKQYGINKAKNNWILILDADERITSQLRDNIINEFKSVRRNISGFKIGFINHFSQHVLYHGGENYYKIRLFNKHFVQIKKKEIHEGVVITKGKIIKMDGKILHYSYPSLIYVLKKFFNYSKVDARTRINIEKYPFYSFITYPMHMFYSRFVKERGYKDGFYGLLLAFCFTYLEFFIQFNILLIKLKLIKNDF